jgi:hypothetical protein
MADESKIIISDSALEDYKKTAVKWQKELLDLPIRQAQNVLQYMRGITVLRGDMMLPAVTSEAQYAPYDPDRKSAANVNIDYRKLTTYFGNDVNLFHPNDYAFLTMGYNAPTLGEGQKRAPQTLLILSQIAKSRGQYLAQAVFTGKRNEKGTTTADLFDGFETIADKEIADGNISVEKKNLYNISDKLTAINTCDILKDLVYSRNHFLRAQESILLCSQDLADLYNESYLQTHNAVPYNTKFNQPTIEGSNGRITIIPLPELAGTNTMYLTQKDNLLWGTDNVSDQSTVDILREGHYRLSFASNIFFGVQFHTIDPRKLTIVKLTGDAANQ